MVLRNGVRRFFSFVGRSHKKDACALILSDCDTRFAADIAGVNTNYIHSSRSPSFNPTQHRLCTELYTSTKTFVHPIEVTCTLTHMRSRLEHKSGQKAGDRYFRSDPQAIVYHEDYQQL